MDVDMNIDESRDAEIEDLRSSISQAERLTNRLRDERDRLRTDYEFFQLEMKFKVETLERKLQAAESYSQSLEESDGASMNSTSTLSNVTPGPSLHTYRRAALVSSLVMPHLQEEAETYESQLSATLKTLHSAQQRVLQVEGLLRSRDHAIDTLQKDNGSLQEQLDSSEEELSTTKRQIRDLTSRIVTLEQAAEKERREHEERESTLARTEAEFKDMSRNLADAVSARDSLSLQATHLEQDLGHTKRELDRAEARYSELQSQQLSSMSSSEATRALRKQIVELEQRVLRRTEQIGVHQHDVKRLEANLRLQEDRLTEMTSELDIAQSEKAAMLEDCETTREQRDVALRKCEELEEKMEAAEEKMTQLEGRRDLEIQSLVELIMRGVSMRQVSSKAMLSSLSRHVAEASQLRASLHEVDLTRSQTSSKIQHLQAVIEEKTLALQSLDAERQKALAEVHAAKESLQTAQINSRETTSRFDELREQNASLQNELVQLRRDFQSKVDELFTLQQEYACWQLQDSGRRAEDRARYEARIEELEEECGRLRDAQEDWACRYAEVQGELKRANEQLQTYGSSSTERDAAEKTLRADLSSLQQTYDEETKRLRDDLTIAQANLEGARQQQLDLESSHKDAIENITKAKAEIEAQLKVVIAKLDATAQTESDLSVLRNKYEEQVKDLEERLDSACTDLDSVSKERDELLEQHDASCQKLRDVEFQLSELRTRYDAQVQDLHNRLSQAFKDLDNASKGQSEREATLQSTVKRLQEEVSTWSSEKETLNAEFKGLHDQHADLESRLSAVSSERETLVKEHEELKARHEQIVLELNSTKTDGDGRLAQLSQEVEQLRAQLKAQSEEHSQLQQQHTQAVARNEQAEQARTGLVEELGNLTAQLQESTLLLEQLKREKQELQEQMTDLEAQVQRSISMQRYQDSQIKEREREVTDLQEKYSRTQTSLQQLEQASKAAEAKFMFEIAENEQTIASLRREIQSLRGNSSLQEAIAELREKNEEMEQLLRVKCLEIEENDDKFIELIKEKKKLNSKVESLTRKVNNLQAKLTAPTPAVSQTDVAPAMSLHASTSRAPATMTPATRNPPTPSSSRSRTLSGPSTFSRPKTSDHRVPPPPVFRARTPESKRLPSLPSSSKETPPSMPESSSSSSTLSAGKKRRAPDDFDDCESLPPQVFTSDSVPSNEGDAFTPRIRRALHKVGFTPVRNSATRPQASHASPRRATTGTPIIADVTNSPRSKHGEHADKKRGWLGKMRGGQAPPRMSRPVFERPQNYGAGTGP